MLSVPQHQVSLSRSSTRCGDRKRLSALSTSARAAARRLVVSSKKSPGQCMAAQCGGLVSDVVAEAGRQRAHMEPCAVAPRTNVQLRKVPVGLAVARGGLQGLHGRQLGYLLHQRRQQACR